MAWTTTAEEGHVVASNHCLYAVDPAGERTLARPWHLVDAARWDHDEFTLTVTWVDGGPAVTWVLPQPGLLPETVRERVQASVVLAQQVDLPGQRSARVVVRSDLSTGSLLDQVLLGPGVRAGDPGVRERTEPVRADLREQVGLV